MKPSIKITGCMVFLSVMVAIASAPAQDDKLIGVWKVTLVTFKGPNAQVITNPPPSICIFTKKYMSLVGVRGEEPRPKLPENPNVDQLVAAWQSLAASVSTYDVKGDTITIHPIVGKSPNIKPGDFITLDHKFEGDNLWVTPKSDQDGPIENPYTLEFMRVE